MKTIGFQMFSRRQVCVDNKSNVELNEIVKVIDWDALVISVDATTRIGRQYCRVNPIKVIRQIHVAPKIGVGRTTCCQVIF